MLLKGLWPLFTVLCAACDGERTSTAAPTPSPVEQLVNRVWTKPAADGLPGLMRIFLADGVLVQDSCWETHRLSPWSLSSEGVLIWDEDGRSITADIVAVDERALILRLHLSDGDEEQRFVPASAPYVCPDLPR